MTTPRKNSRLAAKMDCSFEVAARSFGIEHVCGLDEAGRGPLAGPVVAAAVIMPPGCDIAGIMDSKKLTPKQREIVYEKILEVAVDYRVESVGAPAIDQMNILQASLYAMRRAVEGLRVKPGLLFVDGKFPVPGDFAQMALVDGDARCMSVAAASILAKVSRDRRMHEYDELYPGYGFSKHKGYGTAEHIECLKRLGPCQLHRRTFEPVRSIMIKKGSIRD